MEHCERNFTLRFESHLVPLDPQDFGFLDPDPQKYADPRIQGVKYQPKTEIIKISSFLNGS